MLLLFIINIPEVQPNHLYSTSTAGQAFQGCLVKNELYRFYKIIRQLFHFNCQVNILFVHYLAFLPWCVVETNHLNECQLMLLCFIKAFTHLKFT